MKWWRGKGLCVSRGQEDTDGSDPDQRVRGPAGPADGDGEQAPPPDRHPDHRHLCGIAGADGWEEIAEYGRRKEAFFRRFLALPNGIPSHDTFYRVFARLDPDAFADRFGRWMAGRPCDGSTRLRPDPRRHRREERPPVRQATFAGCLHLVEAWAVGNRLILGPAVGARTGGHEITTFPDLLAALDLTGAVVTMDAAGCQTETLEQIRERGGEYVVCVKGNQPTLRDAIAGVFDRAGEPSSPGATGTRRSEDGARAARGAVRDGGQDPEGLPAGGRVWGRWRWCAGTGR